MDSAFSIIKPVHNLNTPIIVFPSGEWEATQPEGLVFVFADLLLPNPDVRCARCILSFTDPRLPDSWASLSFSMLVFLH